MQTTLPTPVTDTEREEQIQAAGREIEEATNQ